ncbi:hypothetical protein KAZ93_05055 [Patescibacteria group bacterium]|nr:hypothetical protein [Patescibacteria group bacterium]
MTTDQPDDSLGTVDSSATSITVANNSKTNQDSQDPPNTDNHQANDFSGALLLE